MSSDGFRSRRLVEAVIKDVNLGWTKASKRQGHQQVVTSGNVKLVFRSSQSAAEDMTVLDVMRPAGSGAFKDVFFLDQVPFRGEADAEESEQSPGVEPGECGGRAEEIRPVS